MLRAGAGRASWGCGGAVPVGDAGSDGRRPGRCARQARATDPRDSSIRRAARVAGHRLLPAQAQTGWGPRARHGSEVERRQAGRRTGRETPMRLLAAVTGLLVLSCAEAFA